MKSFQIRKTFLDFFASKEHRIVPSAPMVIKDDPTLMFTNAGMNQFKDIFLGNLPAKFLRVANTQKCLRVSGKHNDLEEVGIDTYHHTMFEMLGNWSFGNYFKKEAIEWAWELLTEIYGIKKDNLYVTVFEGDKEENLPADIEALEFWKQHISEDRILFGSKKDNFWEMGDTGPCGPCSEIHVDLRSEPRKKEVPGHTLVNKGDPEVIEIWNLVFIEFNRKSDGSLVPLPQKHVDTGMGFERLCMALQGKRSNYDTDVFQPIIQQISKISGFQYGIDPKKDIAMRVVADHLRAGAFAIADGQLPSNTGAGYVIRRILRRAIRYGFTFLDLKDPFIFSLLPVLVDEMGEFFPELKSQQDLIRKVVAEEEHSFLRTLSHGIRRFEQYVSDHSEKKIIDGDFAFELFDTFGFPVDLTRLMASEIGWATDMEGFNKGLEAQKERSRQAAQVDARDWVLLREDGHATEFVGYEMLEVDVNLVKYRKVDSKKESYYEIVLDKTPFYAESGGQVGDRGIIFAGDEKIEILDTYKEHELIVHKAKTIFKSFDKPMHARVDLEKRISTANNHSATHLMHAALRQVLGKHVEQRGSLVDENRLRFDFSHFAKMTEEEILEVEKIVNRKIRENIRIDEKRDVPFDDAKNMGAMALFGEKYGEKVRVISFDQKFSVELCGGTHVAATGQIGFFKIVSEGAIAAGIRRIEAVTGSGAEEYILEQQKVLAQIQEVLKNAKDLVKGVRHLAEENKNLQRHIEQLSKERVETLRQSVKDHAEVINGITFIGLDLKIDTQSAKDLAFLLKNDFSDLFVIIGARDSSRVSLNLFISETLITEKKLHAGNIIRELAKEIQGGGGGQPHFASAGGSNAAGIPVAIRKAREVILGIGR